MLHYLRLLLLLTVSTSFIAFGAEEPGIKVDAHWETVIRVSKTVPTLLYIGTPLTKRARSFTTPC